MQGLAAAQLVLLFAVSASLVFLSHEFTREAGRVASIWPLNAVVLAVLIRQPSASWPAIVVAMALGNLSVNAAMGDPLWVSLLLTSANVVEVLICARLLKRRDTDFDITRTPDLLRFVAVAGMLAPAAAACIAAATLASSQPFPDAFGVWFAADALGMLVFGPACLVLGAQTPRWSQIKPHLAALALSAVVLAVALGVVFWQTSYPLLFLIPPALTLATFRLGIAGAAAGIVLTSLVAIAFTVVGHGPMQLIAGSETERAIVLQAFLAIMSLTSLPVAAAIEQSLRVQADLANAKAKAQASEARYRALCDTSLDMIARVELDATIRFVSPSCRVVLGYSPEELIGTKTISHMHPDDVPEVIAFFDRLTAAGPGAPPLSYRFRARRADGAYIWLEGIPRILFDADGTPLEVQDSTRDVTSRTELEKELSEARTAAENAARAKGDFLANMSHELRTPLHSIVGFSRLLLKSTALSPTDSRHVDLIATSSQGLLAIVNDILDFSTLEGAAVRLESAPMSVATLVRRCLDSLRVQADAKSLELTVLLDPAIASAHIGDKARLNQILINLVGNAIKFTAAGQVSLRVAANPVGADRQRLRFEVSDTGIGIAADRIDDLFVRFSQLDSSISRRFGGTGLGLAISKHLVDLMGGDVGVTSREGVGSTFWFSVDLAIAEVAPSTAEVSHGALGPAEPGRRILVVDDVDLNRELAVAMLADSRHQVDVAADGAEAIEMVRARAYDLVFMDVQMPGMDGLAATRAIRTIASCKGMPIIAMTAQALPAQIAACRAAGMDDHLAKPIAPEGLQAMIARWTTTRSLHANPAPRTLMEDLQARFVDRSRQDRTRLAELLATAAPSDLNEVRALVHRFAGTAGTFGFPGVGDHAAALDRRLAAGEATAPEDYAPLLRALDDLLQAA